MLKSTEMTLIFTHSYLTQIIFPSSQKNNLPDYIHCLKDTYLIKHLFLSWICSQYSNAMLTLFNFTIMISRKKKEKQKNSNLQVKKRNLKYICSILHNPPPPKSFHNSDELSRNVFLVHMANFDPNLYNNI